jgi:hypothetical protein
MELVKGKNLLKENLPLALENDFIVAELDLDEGTFQVNKNYIK